MEIILREPIQRYLTEKENTFTNNGLANHIRLTYPELIRSILPDDNRYKVKGSPGITRWTNFPWIAIFDTIVTESAQSGYYIVFLFKSDMSGVYLSLNQGVTSIKARFKKEAVDILKATAKSYRSKLIIDEGHQLIIDLAANNTRSRLYEAGNIVAKYYDASNLPNTEQLTSDIYIFLNYYNEVILNDTSISVEEDDTVIEQKKYRLHYRIERRKSISDKVKRHKGYTCEACTLKFTKKYGELGKKFIEVHHLVPISTLDLGEYRLNVNDDFAVLCSNCHRMIHRLDDPSRLDQLRDIIERNR